MNSDSTVRRVAIIVAVANLAYFCVEFGVGLRQHSVSLFADSIDFLEDAALNVLLVLGLQMSAPSRSKLGRCMALILLIPGLCTLGFAIHRWLHPFTPDGASLGLVGMGALVVNLSCALMLAQVRHDAGSLTKAAFLSARNDAIANVAVISAGLFTLRWSSGWPDLLVGTGILILNADACKKVWGAAVQESAPEELES